jgi:hypothetical protein
MRPCLLPLLDLAALAPVTAALFAISSGYLDQGPVYTAADVQDDLVYVQHWHHWTCIVSYFLGYRFTRSFHHEHSSYSGT